MAKKDFGLVVVGNALVDVLARADEAFVAQQARDHGMKRGAMNLISAERAKELYALMGPAEEMSGGSGANSLSGFASFGGKGAFIGKVADDEFGEIFTHDLRAQGIHFGTPAYNGLLESGRSYILVTPDKERTMNTYLGASTKIDIADIDDILIARSRILLLEGYLFDEQSAKNAFLRAARAARTGGTQVAFTLSDHRCVERHHADFDRLVHNYVDILIGNEKEIQALTLKPTFEAAVQAIKGACNTLVLTRGAKGALIIRDGQSYDIPAIPPEKLEDTTGAGDAFAGGVLYGLSEKMTADKAGLLGAKAASKTISHIGARSPGVKFSDLLL